METPRRRLASLRALSWADRVTAAAAFGWLLAAEAGLRVFGLPRTRRLLAPRRLRTSHRPAPAEVERLTLLTRKACRAVYPAGCLPRSLVLERCLQRAGAPAELRIGVRLEEGRFDAHAWVEVDGAPVGEPEGVELRFARLEDTSRPPAR